MLFRSEQALNSSTYLQAYRQYTDRYGLGYSQRRMTEATLAAYTGAIELGYARPQPK